MTRIRGAGPGAARSTGRTAEPADGAENHAQPAYEWEQLRSQYRNGGSAGQPGTDEHRLPAPQFAQQPPARTVDPQGGFPELSQLAACLCATLDPDAGAGLNWCSTALTGPATSGLTRLRLLSGAWAGLVIEMHSDQVALHVTLLPQHQAAFNLLLTRRRSLQAALSKRLGVQVRLEVEHAPC